MLMRMPDRLQFEIDIAPELREMRFPAMALLTLVENAVRHGIDPSEQGGAINLRAWRDGDMVHISVTDSGVGMNETAAPGTGLANLQQRLVGVYGADACLDLSDNSPTGLCAELRFNYPH